MAFNCQDIADTAAIGISPFKTDVPIQPKLVVLNLSSLRTGKLSNQILRTGGLSKSNQNVITTKICNSKEV